MQNPEYNSTNLPRAKFIGYIADLVDKLSHVIGFDYVIYPVADQSFGHKRVDGSWDGIVGELVSGVSVQNISCQIVCWIGIQNSSKHDCFSVT